MAEIINRYTDERLVLGESHEQYLVKVEDCGLCAGRRTDIPACGYMQGTLDELLFWVSRGRRFTIRETACIALGDPACVFAIDKVPPSSAGA